MVKKPNRKIVLGITGSFGSGKSTVAKMFKARGAEVVDADLIGHGLLRPGTGVYQKIIREFGREILMPEGSISRSKLSSLVFKDEEKLTKLNRIMHPEIIRIIKNKISSSRSGILILDAPLLIESGLNGFVDKMIVVKINRGEQLKRIASKAHLSGKQALRRIRAQMPLKDKIRLADFVIDNNGSISQTRKQVGQIRRLLWRS
ncbi:MAG: dephospho-CoA kinase [Candidatus Omnitrophota bacterium]|nr:dephospho-CoA kinase [Candidatus Omnitrophota bacterium]MBU1928879.1 dephospho-CoA kinase [Candidatus Omnitrophota bacterium]MBU2034489.1 dephospho-CoA kinase [Candidatus Omnitrophota bacterium]MBU2221818.1 dephospho-CoA kinase [Candidatus Omnitrophota bacterium]MBU2258322.1 dephospho-CoA kinase [Candidatus Omnitrophota bacterium]